MYIDNRNIKSRSKHIPAQEAAASWSACQDGPHIMQADATALVDKEANLFNAIKLGAAPNTDLHHAAAVGQTAWGSAAAAQRT
jgi:hypothetical protein